ncbi:4Fe-4S single cluster domain-containing protein [Pseudolysinimonas sp.]|jgi:anaerobic ribonucleoside-triphosphate reductase activating protein|uniref:4Fe-4S single cluster domain-containing protein n=1 Tax=Pseudolysinimonas sp. TaxID=2680009 RepID=UPI0037851A87
MTDLLPPGSLTIPQPRSAASLRWSRFLASTTAEGPGTRAAVWVQGCSVKCPGCFNPHLWAERGGRDDAPAELAQAWVAEARAAGVEGITLLGGEPFDQAAALSVVATAFQDAGLTVMTFTGYTLEQLDAWSAERADIRSLLETTDLLADGPYLANRPDTVRPWIGSTNQGLRALTPAYRDLIASIEERGGQDRLEIRIARDGTIAVNGWADDEVLELLLGDLGVRADRPRDTSNIRLKETA